MIDLVKLNLRAGNGGNGKVAFRREKYVPKGGPSGGNGGDGGHIIIEGVDTLSSLHHLAGVKGYEAKAGQSGGNKKKSGSKGESVVIQVPVGTRVWLLAENEVSQKRRFRYSLDYTLNRDEVDFIHYYVEAAGSHAPAVDGGEILPILSKDEVEKLEAGDASGASDVSDASNVSGASDALRAQFKLLKKVLRQSSENLKDVDFRKLPKQQLVEITEPGQRVVVCQGGFGGRGNTTFKSSAKTTPLEADQGTPGEQKVVVLEQLLLADIGLVGFPNAGKSTLVSVLTSAQPKVGNYPFTTLEPHLGVMNLHDQEVVVADIPGLIEGASEGKGLGHAFLRHVEHCRVLLYVLALSETVIFDEELSKVAKAKTLYQQFCSSKLS